MKKKVLTVLLALVLALSLCLVTAVPVAAVTLIHVPGTYGTIQAAINAAGPDDIIIVAAGMYTEDLVIPVGKENLELVGATGAIIKGQATELDSEFPYTVPNINILANGVTIHGFTIESPTAVVDEYASGMLIGASNVEIYDNAFVTNTQVAGQYSVVIQTWRRTVAEFGTVDISGLNIHNNTFGSSGTVGDVGYDGIFINLDNETGPITIAGNTFGGSLIRAISVERSNVVIGGNTIGSELAPGDAYQGMYIGCFPVDGQPGPQQTNVSIIGNTVEGFAQGIRVGSTTSLGFSGIVVSGNTVQYNTDGIVVKAPTGATVGVVISYNNIVDNTDFGVNNYTAVSIDATLNWWGTTVGTEIMAKVSGNVNYSLWLGAEYSPSTVTMSAEYIYTPPLIGISVLPTTVDFGAVEPNVASTTQTVTVTNTGNVPEDFDASLTNISTPDVYTTGLIMDVALVAAWEELNVAPAGTSTPDLILTVPGGTAPGTYTATVVFWAIASP